VASTITTRLREGKGKRAVLALLLSHESSLLISRNWQLLNEVRKGQKKNLKLRGELARYLNLRGFNNSEKRNDSVPPGRGKKMAQEDEGRGTCGHHPDRRNPDH